MELLIVAISLALLLLGPKISVWRYRRRQRRAELEVKRRQDRYHADCRRTGHYDY